MELEKLDNTRILELFNSIKEKTEYFLGYPVSKDFNYSELFEFLKYPLNNLGDPFTDSTWKVDSRRFEREVIEFIAELFGAENDSALSVLNEAGYRAVPDESILVEIKDKPGELGLLSRLLYEDDIDIRSITMMEQCEEENVVAIVTDNDNRARKTLKKFLIK